MTQEEKKMLNELYEWMQARKLQQITEPLDDVSKAVLHTPIFEGSGTTGLTQTLASVPGTVPKAFVRSILLRIEGETYELGSFI